MDENLYLPKNIDRLPDAALGLALAECRERLIPLQGYLNLREIVEREEIEAAMQALEREMIARRQRYHRA